MASAVFAAGNVRLWLAESVATEGLSGICFSVDSQERIRRRMRNLNLTLHEDAFADPLGPLENAATLRHLDRLAPESARGLDLAFVARNENGDSPGPGRVSGLDHAVVASADGDATALLLGARLGLDMRMDLSREEWNARLMFFRCGDLILEVFQQLHPETPVDADRDSFYGLSWRTSNADSTREQLLESGFDVSELRKGRKPGTRVFTVRDRTAAVPTLFIEPAKL